jgi:FKBP-type peptidyl-prolyl cis-trans isomerase FkpA
MKLKLWQRRRAASWSSVDDLGLLVGSYSLIVCLAALSSACAKKEEPPVAEMNTAAQAVSHALPQPGQSVTELKLEDVKVGTGDDAVAGKSVTVHYTGWLTNGTKFDSSKDRGQPFTFQLGAGQVIRGWDQGVAGMKVGGVRKLTIPSSLAYGENGAGGVIPPNATLVFEVELLGVN